MDAFLQAIMGFPSVVYTALLGAVLIYWAVVLVMGIDVDNQADASHHGPELDSLDHAHHDGELDGGDPHHHGALDTAHDVFDLLGTVALKRVPLTVRLSLVVIFAWLVSVLAWISLAPLMPAALPLWTLRATLAVVSALAGLRLAGWAARPLVPVFTPKHAPSQSALAGRDGEVTTGRVDRSFGQILVNDGGAGLLVDARYEGGAPLPKGARVVVTHWDPELGCAHVEPIDFATTKLRLDTVTAADGADVEHPASGVRPEARRGQKPSR